MVDVRIPQPPWRCRMKLIADPSRRLINVHASVSPRDARISSYQSERRSPRRMGSYRGLRARRIPHRPRAPRSARYHRQSLPILGRLPRITLSIHWTRHHTCMVHPLLSLSRRIFSRRLVRSHIAVRPLRWGMSCRCPWINLSRTCSYVLCRL